MVLCIGNGRFPMLPLTLITALFCYTIVILPTEVSDVIWLSVTSGILVILFVYIVSILFVRDIIQNPRRYSGLGMVLGVLDIAVSLIHALATMMYIIIVSRSPTFTDFTLIPVGETGYQLFWTRCLANTVGYFFSAGVVNSTGISGWGVLQNIVTVMTGSAVTLFALALAVSRLVSSRTRKVRINPNL